jgi:hypothetical protein
MYRYNKTGPIWLQSVVPRQDGTIWAMCAFFDPSGGDVPDEYGEYAAGHVSNPPEHVCAPYVQLGTVLPPLEHGRIVIIGSQYDDAPAPQN